MKTGDSSSWTSLSIWINMLTVISSSALRKERVSTRLRDLEQLLTRLVRGCKLVRRLAQADTERMSTLHCDTRTGTTRRRTSGPPIAGR